jgi:transcription initiation factor TFIIF subunit alpha
MLKKPTGLKRAGSPNLSASEASGNESSRKKQKKKHSSHATGTSTPIPGSRPMSPAPTSQPGSNSSPRKSSIIKLNLNPSKLSEIQSVPPNPSPVTGGATSDGEATGGEMSDGGKRSKVKLLVGGSPTGSRAGSPGVGRAGSGGSRTDSPSAQIQGNLHLYFMELWYTYSLSSSCTPKRENSVARRWTHPASRNCGRAP